MRVTQTLAYSAVLAALALAGCSGGDEEPAGPPEPAQDTSAAPEPADTPEPEAADPYEVYLEIAPDDAVELSREDAQARAFLGCGQTFAPGTVDAALAEAYEGICD